MVFQPSLPFDAEAASAPEPPVEPAAHQRIEPIRSPSSPQVRRGQPSRLIEELARVCAEYPLDEKILVSPSLLVGYQTVERLARSGYPVVQLRVETVRTLAHAVAGPALARDGWKLLSRAQALALVEQACLEMLEDGSYFGPLRDRPGFHRAIHAAFDELRGAGFEPDSLPARAFADRRKPAELTAILRRYAAALEQGRWIDGAGVLRQAVVAARPDAGSALYLLPLGVELSRTEALFLDKLAGRRKLVLATDAPDSWAERAAGAPMRRAVGEENEIRSVLRDILASGLPFDHFEILHTDAATYPALAWELCAQYEIPATFSGGVAAAFTRPGRAVLAFLRWIGRGFEADALREALASGFLAFPKGMGSRVPPAAAAREMRRAAIGWGRHRHLPALDRLGAEIAFRKPRSDEEDDPRIQNARRERRLAVVAVARKFIARALSLAPPDGLPADLSTFARGARAFLSEFGHAADELDGAAAAALAQLFSELESLPPGRGPIEETAARLEDAVLSLHVVPDRPRPGRVHFADFRSGGFSGRPRTLLIGLDEKRHPGGEREDPVLSDDERRRINELSSAGLTLAPDRARESSTAMRTCVARLRGEIAFVYSGWNLRDLANPGEVFPSPFLLEAFRLRPGEKDADYERLAAFVGEGDGFVPSAGRALDETEWWLATIGDARGPQPAAAVARLHPWLADGIRAEDARESAGLTAFDGVFSCPAPELDPRANGSAMSASRIQALADCPFGYFLAHVLKLSSPDEPEQNGAEWLDARTAGSVIHRVFRRFLEEASASGRRPSYPADLPAILAIADAELEDMRRKLPPRSELAFSRRREEVHFACRTFLISESSRPAGVEPVAFEVGFGLVHDERSLDDPEPVAISLSGGRTVKLRGSIDRVDRDASGGYHLWDYKTGTSAFTHEERGIAAGRQIQPALYALAWESLLERRGRPGRVVESGYFFPGRRGLGERFAIRSSAEETRRTLDVLLDLLAAGAFPHSPDEDSDCFVCRELSVFCADRKAAGRASHAKLFRAQSPALAAWRRLRDA